MNDPQFLWNIRSYHQHIIVTFGLHDWFLSRECPEDCREAVSSLIFAAARFSDLPELRDLRDTFLERYGNSLECFVNQKVMLP